ncbi:DNA-binding protein [Streptomyces albus subsp. chlorinus]|uniref:DNA-binding protein n=1 Tax=Streptomyces albus TaxID=1888 RepID=UPI00156F1C8E|nr:DNA-binding protein [Streptomyces albus]NSC23543.1 DNA-binding protein [Streptomyces albus subsp. chlorinus]
MTITQEIAERLQALATGEGSPEEASAWALAMMEGDAPELEDENVWNALDQLSGADLMMDPETPMHSEEQYRQWLQEFREKVSIT